MPEAALREAANAIIHKDYSSGTPIQMSVYPDKLMLWNPGELLLDWTVAELKGKHPSQPFTPDVANYDCAVSTVDREKRTTQQRVIHEPTHLVETAPCNRSQPARGVGKTLK